GPQSVLPRDRRVPAFADGGKEVGSLPLEVVIGSTRLGVMPWLVTLATVYARRLSEGPRAHTYHRLAAVQLGLPHRRVVRVGRRVRGQSGGGAIGEGQERGDTVLDLAVIGCVASRLGRDFHYLVVEQPLQSVKAVDGRVHQYTAARHLRVDEPSWVGTGTARSTTSPSPTSPRSSRSTCTAA